ASPVAERVVDVDRRHALVARDLEALDDCGQPRSERGQERLPVVVVESVDDVDDEERVVHEPSLPATPTACSDASAARSSADQSLSAAARSSPRIRSTVDAVSASPVRSATRFSCWYPPI